MRRILKLLHVRTSIVLRDRIRPRPAPKGPRSISILLLSILDGTIRDRLRFASNDYKFDIVSCLPLTSIDEEESTLFNPANVFSLPLCLSLSDSISYSRRLIEIAAHYRQRLSLTPIIIVYLCDYMYNLWTQRVALFSRRLVNIIHTYIHIYMRVYVCIYMYI